MHRYLITKYFIRIKLLKCTHKVPCTQNTAKEKQPFILRGFLSDVISLFEHPLLTKNTKYPEFHILLFS